MKMDLIYLVEDEKFFSSIALQMLKSMGYHNVAQYYSGKDIRLNLYKNPDIVILDHNLGDENGIEILREIKSVNPNIEVIFLSGQEEMQVAINSLKYGAFDYVTKNEECFEKLKKTLNKLQETKRLLEQKSRRANFAKRLLAKLGLF